MPNRLITISAAFAIGLSAIPLSTAKGQYTPPPNYPPPYYPPSYYPPPCSPFPLFWPFCVVGAVVGTAAMIVTAPFRALTGAPPFYYGYPGPPYYPLPAYSPPSNYAPPNYNEPLH
jgi:hypothetical protein